MAHAARRPVIGVTGPRRGARGPRACVHVALRLTGARPVHLRPGDPADVTGLDGVVVTGGHDVEPTLYAAPAEVQGRYDPERDRFESDVIGSALALGRPLLAICRGAQLLNVHLGGSLFQDLRARRKHTSNRSTLLPMKTLDVVADTRLSRCLDAASVKVNSLHRQAIDRLGKDLCVSGRDLDGIVQAVEHTGRDFVLGVQWHPEFLLYLPRQLRLFRRLVESTRRSEATELRGAHPVSHQQKATP